MTARAMPSRSRFVPFSASVPKTRGEVKGRNLLFEQSDALIAVEWLNATKATAANLRVLDLRHKLEDLGSELIDLRKWLIEAVKSFRETPQKMNEVNKLRERFRKRHNALNQIFARYTLVPAMAYSVEVGVWRFNTIPKRTRGPVIKLDDQIGIIRVDETTVIAALARLATNRRLYKVRLCVGCGQRWLVSLRAIDKFCTAACRVSFHVHSEEGKRRHREAQRKYRHSPGYGL